MDTKGWLYTLVFISSDDCQYTLQKQPVGLRVFPMPVESFSSVPWQIKSHQNKAEIRATDDKMFRLSQMLINVSTFKQRALYNLCIIFPYESQKGEILWNKSKHCESKNHSPVTLHKVTFGQRFFSSEVGHLWCLILLFSLTNLPNFTIPSWGQIKLCLRIEWYFILLSWPHSRATPKHKPLPAFSILLQVISSTWGSFGMSSEPERPCPASQIIGGHTSNHQRPHQRSLGA